MENNNALYLTPVNIFRVWSVRYGNRRAGRVAAIFEEIEELFIYLFIVHILVVVSFRAVPCFGRSRPQRRQNNPYTFTATTTSAALPLRFPKARGAASAALQAVAAGRWVSFCLPTDLLVHLRGQQRQQARRTGWCESSFFPFVFSFKFCRMNPTSRRIMLRGHHRSFPGSEV